jgi:hypothetical protein
MQCDCRHGVHIRLRDIFDHNWNVVVPSSDSFIVGCCYEPPVLVHEGDSVDRTQMLIVFLRDLPRVHVILLKSAGCRDVSFNIHLDNFLVHHTCQEDVLFVFVWMEPENMCHLSIGEVLETLSSFCVP